MGAYTDHVLPRIIDVACNVKEARAQRHRVCEGLSGEIVEIGFGSGLNVPFYPTSAGSTAATDVTEVG